MDRYATDLKIQEIKNMYAADDLKAAAGLAQEINWAKVKKWEPLAMMIDIYEKTQDNQSARDMAILAYNRNLGGRRLVYRLTDLLIKTGDYTDAKELYEEYASIARSSADRHILKYHLLRDTQAPVEEQIRALEAYTGAELNEVYMYRLAGLYAKNGDTTKCISICDDICTMFKDGEYVDGAVMLKHRIGGTLSPEQDKIYKASKVKEEELSKTQQLLFSDQMYSDEDFEDGESGYSPDDDNADEAYDVSDDENNNGFEKNDYASDDTKELSGENINENRHDDEFLRKTEEIFKADNAQKSENTSAFDTQDINVPESAESAVWNINDDTSANSLKDSKSNENKSDSKKKKALGAAVAAAGTATAAATGFGSNMSEDLKNKIIAARNRIDERKNKASYFEDTSEAKENGIEVPDEVRADVREILSEESALKGEGTPATGEQIDGQVNMGEWLNDVHDTKNQTQKTKEYSKTELERELEEKNKKSEAYDILMAEQKKLADESGTPFDEDAARKNVEQQLIFSAARNDLTLRTGKAAARIEAENKINFPSVEPKVSESLSSGKDDSEDKREKLLKVEAAVVRSIQSGSVDPAAFPSFVPGNVMSAIRLVVNYLSGADVSKENANNLSGIDEKGKEPTSGAATVAKTAAVGVGTGIVAGQSVKDTEEVKGKEVIVEKETKETQINNNDVVSALKDEHAEKTSSKNKKKKNKKKNKEDSNIVEEKIQNEKENVEVVKTVEAKEEIKEEAKTEVKTEAAEPKEVKGAEVKPDVETQSDDSDVKISLKNVTHEDVTAILDSDEKAVADRINSEDAAVDEITARITGAYKKPIITPEMEASLDSGDTADDIHIQEPDSFNDTTHIDKQMLREIIESGPDAALNGSAEGPTKRFDTTTKHDTKQIEALLSDNVSKSKKDKLLNLFADYYDMPEANNQIESYIAALPKYMNRSDSASGNILISGEPVTDKTGLAKIIAKAINISYPENRKKLIKTTGESLNNNGIAVNISRLTGTILIIEEASGLSAEMSKELTQSLQGETGRMIVILEDTESGIDSLRKENPEIDNVFNHRIDLRVFSVQELVEIACELSAQKGYEINPEARLALFLAADELNSKNGKVGIQDMENIVDSAIGRWEKRVKREKNTEQAKKELIDEDFKM